MLPTLNKWFIIIIIIILQIQSDISVSADLDSAVQEEFVENVFRAIKFVCIL